MPKNAQGRCRIPDSSAHGALADERGGSMKMADGNGESVGSVGRFRYLDEIEQARNHMLYLWFLGPTVTHYRGLDGKRRIFSDFQPGRRGGQHRHSADLPQLERRLYVERIEHIFDGDVVRPVFLDDDAEALKNSRQPPGKRFTRRELDGATS
jgi:hypothetical protein